VDRRYGTIVGDNGLYCIYIWCFRECKGIQGYQGSSLADKLSKILGNCGQLNSNPLDFLVVVSLSDHFQGLERFLLHTFGAKKNP
jgi:hypothetical protein